MANWTDEQQTAIDARNCNLLVSAAAGSGKTAVLVERILQLIIQDGVDIDSLLVVTFTNAAAGEMRERIGASLMQAIDNNTSSNEHLRRQMNLLSKASISTLHAFCISVIRKYFHVINIDPGFRIGDETENSIIKLEVLEELFEMEYEKGSEEFLGLVERFGGNRQDVPLQEMVLRLHGFIQSKPYPGKWLEERVQDFALAVDEIENSPWCRALIAEIKMDIKGAIDILQEALDICRKPNGPDAYVSIILDDMLQLDDLLTALELRGLKSCCNVYQDIKFKTLKRCSKDVDDTLKDAAKNLRDQAKKVLNELGDGILQGSLEHYVEQLHELHPYMHYLYHLVLEFDLEFKLQKQERGIIDFNDLEHYTLDILQHEEVAKELQQKYSYIFIDEYQDSNIVQETILSHICRADNLFMVGDVKQSIYRFRLADPSIFLSKYGTYAPLDGVTNRRVDLNKNFRSRPHILNGVNYIFENIMSAHFGELDYDEYAALYTGLDMVSIQDPEVELHLVEKVANEEAELESDIEDMSDVEVEAMVAAQRINELLQSEIYDTKLEAYRKLEYRDMVILMRSTKGWVPVFQEVLAAKGIPVYADVNSGYFEVLEIKTMVSLLKIIDNKCQDIPLLTVLRSPIGGFNAEDLIQIRTNSRAKNFYNTIAEYMINNDDNLSERLKAFYQLIDEWQQAARYLPMEDFIWKLFTESGYYYYAGAMPGGLQRQANLRILLDRARQFQQTSIKGLFQFIRFIDKLQSSSGDMGVAKTLNENENVLRIMSIHKSKGLEFPVVIVAGLGKQFNMMDTNAPVLFHKDLGLGPKYINPETRQSCDTIAKIAMKQVIKLESLSEEMRILYVALTRPKDKLILLGSVRNMDKTALKWAKKISPFYLSKGKTFLDWICPVLMRHENCSKLRELLGAEDFEEPLTDGPSGWKVELHGRGDISTFTKGSFLNQQDLLKRLENSSETLDDELERMIAERFSWNYPHRFAVDIPSKLTVTEVKRINASRDSEVSEGRSRVFSPYTPTLIERPKFMEGVKQFTAAEKGTIIHFVMQHLDLTRVEDVEMIQLQVQNMILLELLTEDEAQVVDIELVYLFFQSNTGQRILKAPRVWREIPFNYRKEASEVINGLDREGETLLIQGIIDCYFEEDGQWILVDYKTDFILSDAKIDIIVSQYRIQIDLYTEALEKITGKPVKERILYLLSINQAIPL